METLRRIGIIDIKPADSAAKVLVKAVHDAWAVYTLIAAVTYLSEGRARDAAFVGVAGLGFTTYRYILNPAYSRRFNRGLPGLEKP